MFKRLDPTTRLVNILTSLLQLEGGLSALLTKISNHGYSELVRSWLGGERNLQLTPEQMRAALGDDHLRTAAALAGVRPDKFIEEVAKYLPAIVDRLTPEGELPTGAWSAERVLADVLSAFRSKTPQTQ